ncbi:cytochrome bc complex cytochrome b subunit [Halalkaliarchaeum sp. AArc-GB]|uniref:cytochrome b n=1 Tax=Halalkaliarchaeum sp. AArc-GB TaxID=3074078 RepID=UPI0028650FD8|nr:cytochrome bc complex cytochrome b subunit [Halalkaliarchaeum sp. AArc-GB]MDR5674084.1 cytochrome bc complex cytochrome b subunit [Halalkaliarchaeum sp. AArc-GB]
MSRLDRYYRRGYEWFDERLDLDSERSTLGKAFPAEDSFLLGEVALFSFVVLVLTGIFLGFFYQPNTAMVEYQGSIAQFHGEEVPQAFASVLAITYDISYGMFIRRIHHWAAHLFIASAALHMMRVFFQGAYRNPREPNWVIGVLLVVLGMAAGFTGYVLPYDNFAAEAASIGYVVASSTPIVGDSIAWIFFGGDYPTALSIPRMYFLHVLVIPLLIGILLAAHMVILYRQKHTEGERDEDFTGEPVTPADAPTASPVDEGGSELGLSNEPTSTDGGQPETAAAAGGDRTVDRDDDGVVVGLPLFPQQAALSAIVFFLTLGTLSLLSGFFSVHNIVEYGPYDPTSTPELVLPDWYLMWMFGILKLLPDWVGVGPLTVEFVGGVLVTGLVILLVLVWPFIDRYEEPGHFVVDPLERDWQTATGVAGIVFLSMLSLGGMNTVVSDLTGIATSSLNPILLSLAIILPIVAWLIVYATLGGFADDSGDGPEPSGPSGGDEDA